MTSISAPWHEKAVAVPGGVRLAVVLGARARNAAPADLVTLLDCALDAGARLIVVDDGRADSWHSPIGELLAGRREEAVLAGYVGRRAGGSSPAAECRALLRRMRVDRLDLCLLDARSRTFPVEERIGELAELVRAGDVGGLGVYCDDPEVLSRAQAEHALTVAAVDYSLSDRRAEAGVLPTARELGLPVLACRPLAGGGLAGRGAPPDGVAAIRLRAAQRIAAHQDLGIARLALAWLAARSPMIVPAVGCTDPVHLEYDLAALRTRLAPETLAALEAVFPGPRVRETCR